MKAESICLYLTGALLYDPPEGHPGQQAYTFVIRILSTSLTSVSIFSVCFCSRYVYLWLALKLCCTYTVQCTSYSFMWTEKSCRQNTYLCFCSFIQCTRNCIQINEIPLILIKTQVLMISMTTKFRRYSRNKPGAPCNENIQLLKKNIPENTCKRTYFYF
jgi:hypothetical protein